MKRIIIMTIAIAIVVGAIFVAVKIGRSGEEEEQQTIITEIANEEILDECTEEYEEIEKQNLVEVNSDEERISPPKEDEESEEDYVVRESGGNVVIYQVLEDGTEKLYEVTGISSEYLTDTDKINMANGIYVNGRQELNQLIENFE